MLMLLLDSASNILDATPLWLCIPAPTMETLAQVVSTLTSLKCALSFSTRMARSASPSEQVKLISFLPSRPVDCRMMSTLMFFWASRPKILKLMPGSSGTFRIVITATSVSFATPLISIPSMSFVTSLTTVPGTGFRLESTSSSTLYFLASSTLRLFSTCAPRDASSSISSKVISSSLRVLRTLRGSAV